MIPFRGCRPTRSIWRMSSRVTSSLPNNPPWTTKKRLRPCGERMTSPLFCGGFVALMSVDNGTSHAFMRRVLSAFIINATHMW